MCSVEHTRRTGQQRSFKVEHSRLQVYGEGKTRDSRLDPLACPTAQSCSTLCPLIALRRGHGDWSGIDGRRATVGPFAVATRPRLRGRAWTRLACLSLAEPDALFMLVIARARRRWKESAPFALAVQHPRIHGCSALHSSLPSACLRLPARPSRTAESPSLRTRSTWHSSRSPSSPSPQPPSPGLNFTQTG